MLIMQPLVSCCLYTINIRQRKKDFREIEKIENTAKRMFTLELHIYIYIYIYIYTHTVPWTYIQLKGLFWVFFLFDNFNILMHIYIYIYIYIYIKNPHVAQIKELAWYVRTQVGVTAGTDMMFNDPKLAMKAGHH